MFAKFTSDHVALTNVTSFNSNSITVFSLIRSEKQNGAGLLERSGASSVSGARSGSPLSGNGAECGGHRNRLEQ